MDMNKGAYLLFLSTPLLDYSNQYGDPLQPPIQLPQSKSRLLFAAAGEPRHSCQLTSSLRPVNHGNST